ncbi:MAG: hypothetical protein B7Z33_03160 [Sphingomonadales bacterium 12-68-11]|nr:MAG: hypothetical protein B7Z33_03160 [Sphingomonadales bacterium 12-68-11]OYX16856.1 MAG: hypothetical protein B7Z07_01745 [Sphingomonadales bacterium 32-67-7]
MEAPLVVAIRFALFADLMMLAGLTAFSLYALKGEERASAGLPPVGPAVALSLAGLALSGIGMLALVAAMTGASVLAIDGAVLQEVVGQSAIGAAWIVRMTAMAVAVAAALALRRFPATARVTLLGASSIAIATLVWSGHAGATEGPAGTVHRVSDIVHMLAAAVWIGGLAAFALLLSPGAAGRPPGQLTLVHRALAQFSRVGTAAVALIVASGIVNSLVLMGVPSVGSLTGSLYGRLLLAKLGLFAAMLMLAGANRWKLTPALAIGIGTGESASALSALRKSLALEGLAALAILALVAWLGTLEPAGTGA